MRFLVFILASAACAQPASKLTGFPFQDETLRYMVRWPSGMTLGEAIFNAHKSDAGWSFATTVSASVPGFAVQDSYRSTATAGLCSLSFERSFSHGAKQTGEKTTFDQLNHRATRVTTKPPSDGKTEFATGECARDAISFVYFMRREMGQGRVAPAETVYFGGGYSVSLHYLGGVPGNGGTVDRVAGSVKGPGSSFSVEIDFERDAARTPLSIRIPLTLGILSAELVR